MAQNKHLSILAFILVTCVCGLTSCSTVIAGFYGIKKNRTVDEETIYHYSKEYNIPFTESYELDTAYLTFLTSLDATISKAQIKNHQQPLQALYYGRNGQLHSFQVNCYAGGFPNLKWDRNEIMTTFPPKQQAPIDSIVTLETQLKYLKPLSRTEIFSTSDYDYIVIVYWSRFMGRQNKRLIQFVQDNSKLATGKKVRILYANTDNIFAL